MAPLQYGLNIQKKGPLRSVKSTIKKRPTIFDEDGDNSEAEEPRTTGVEDSHEISTFDEDAPPTPPKPLMKPATSTASRPPSKSNKPIAITQAQDLSTLRTQKQRQAEAESLDSSIYDYDAAYDALHAQANAKKATDRVDAQERKPKYMENLLAAAEVRKRDQLRADDRLRQHEREAEGEDFKDTEEFVTDSYKRQQEELRRVEEEEKAKEEKEADKRKKAGMGGFYRTVMEEEERRHAEAVEAAKNMKTNESRKQGAQLQEEANTEDAEKTAAEQARSLNAKGANIVVNEEGQVTDKRQLLTAGLNMALKRKADGSVASASPVTQRPVQRPDYHSHAAEDSKRAMRERQTRMVEAQLEQATKKAAEEEAEERAKVERAAKSRKTEGDVSSARERYLQRKKEAAAAAAAGEK